jgi:hypothetical protein
VVHSAAGLGGDGGFEIQFGNTIEFKPAGEFTAKVAPGAFEGGDPGLDLGVAAEVYLHLGVFEVRGNVHLGDYGGGHARIGHFVGNELADFFSQGFGDPLGSMRIHSLLLKLLRLFEPLKGGVHEAAAQESGRVAFDPFDHGRLIR